MNYKFSILTFYRNMALLYVTRKKFFWI